MRPDALGVALAVAAPERLDAAARCRRVLLPVNVQRLLDAVGELLAARTAGSIRQLEDVLGVVTESLIARRSWMGTRHLALFLADHSLVRRIGLSPLMKIKETASFLTETYFALASASALSSACRVALMWCSWMRTAVIGVMVSWVWIL